MLTSSITMGEEKRPEWMSSISAIVDPKDYLLGRKIDKTFELSQKEKAERAREARIELISKDQLKLKADPVVELEKRKRALKLEIISNPIKLKRLRDKLLRMDQKKAAAQHNGISRPDDRSQHTEPSSSKAEGRDDRRYHTKDTRDDHHRSRKRRRSPSTSSSSSARSSSSSSSSSSSESSSSTTSTTYSSSSSADSYTGSSTSSSSASSNYDRRRGGRTKVSARSRPSRSPRRKGRRRHEYHRHHHRPRHGRSRDRHRRSSPRDRDHRKRR